MTKAKTPAQILAHKRKLKAQQQARFRLKRGKTLTIKLADAGAIDEALRAYISILKDPANIHPAFVGQSELEHLEGLRDKLHSGK